MSANGRKRNNVALDTRPRARRGRKTTSCSQCHARKQKCNRELPCSRCIQRGVPELCQWPEKGKSHAMPPERVNTAADTQDTELGQLYIARGAPSFFGNSYFGHQVAARMIQESAPDLPPMSLLSSKDSLQSFRNDSGPFSQVWDLLGLLPRNKVTVDRLIEKFLTEINWAIDTVHPDTFRSQFAEFWGRKFGFDEIAGVDLRWLALLFIILAFSVLLDGPTTSSPEKRKESEEASLRFYWAARRAIVISPSFHGESLDLVRAGLMVTRYLLYTRQVTESWLTISFAMRMAQAQGMHIDGEKWGLSRKATETRRRLWSNLYLLDKTIALALGRPYAISDHMCLIKAPENVWLDGLTDEESSTATAHELSYPTMSTVTILGSGLGKIAGEIQDRCFGLYPASYDMVIEMDNKLVAWKEQLPPYFAVEDPELSLDDSYTFLPWHRLYLHSTFHFARITLHRPYLLRESITNRFSLSHEACISSASSDLKIRLQSLNYGTSENMRWTLGTHNMFNSAFILGIIAVRRPIAPQTAAILNDLEEYCERLRKDVWLNEFGLAEVKVVELCIIRTTGLAQATDQPGDQAPTSPPEVLPDFMAQERERNPMISTVMNIESIEAGASPSHPPASSPDMMWPAVWEDQNFAFPQAADLETWEQMISEIAYHT
ncbi:Fungal transcriptional regulatory protein, N-terminal [Penicillium camemberti]|uniref:Fungal transcriptional regulatory protein, N-terminal n=1 Tax=Penicillium camemberti (strain FM 013) TaxID=1429867 RepID=A0A0G4PM53_PENC3|nr:Fungal transcriptional regulatory protein, N-terminal [Penicillium camemberti]